MKYIDQNKANKFKKVMASPDWEKIKKEYQDIFDHFDKPVEMRIFAYNAEFFIYFMHL